MQTTGVVLSRQINQQPGKIFRDSQDQGTIMLLEAKFSKNRDLAKEGWEAIEHVYVLTEKRLVPSTSRKARAASPTEVITTSRCLIKLKGKTNGWTELEGLDFLLPVPNVAQELINFLAGKA